MYEKVEINHGLLVSTRQMPNTFYHKMVPSKTVKVHINPIVVHHIPLSKLGFVASPKTGSSASQKIAPDTAKVMKPQDQENGGSKGRLCGEVMMKDIKSYLTLAMAFCAIWVRIVSPFA